MIFLFRNKYFSPQRLPSLPLSGTSTTPSPPSPSQTRASRPGARPANTTRSGTQRFVHGCFPTHFDFSPMIFWPAFSWHGVSCPSTRIGGLMAALAAPPRSTSPGQDPGFLQEGFADDNFLETRGGLAFDEDGSGLCHPAPQPPCMSRNTRRRRKRKRTTPAPALTDRIDGIANPRERGLHDFVRSRGGLAQDPRGVQRVP